MFDRDVVLREIGLTPVWRTRTATSIDVDIPPPLQTETDHSAPTESHEARAARIATLQWDELNADIAQCEACKLCQTRIKTVPGVGNRSPDWMVIGEGPGENEDRQGVPFVGRAGQLLDNMLAAAGKSRKESVFITNVVKCRPPGNRDPESDEIFACAPYLERQVALAQPKLLLALGKFAGQKLLATDATVGAMRATPGKRGDIPVVVTYHPSYLLRAPLEKAKAWDDLLTAHRLSETARD